MGIRFQSLKIYGNNRLLICDFRYYMKNENEILSWAKDCTPGMDRQGMVLNFNRDTDISAFMLRWA